jgi:hypothetical protein
MFKTIEDVFNSGKAIFNDPLHEIHNPVQKCEAPPENEDYEDFFNHLDNSVYPTPNNTMVHNTVNPLHGTLKPNIIK